MNRIQKLSRPRLRRLQAALIVPLMVAVVVFTGAWAIGRAGIYNMGPTAAIGVVHNWSNPNRYDAILPVGRSTSGMYGWLYAVGFYTGPGWCTNYYTSAAGGNDSTGLVYVYRWTVRGPTFASKVWADDGAVYSYPC